MKALNLGLTLATLLLSASTFAAPDPETTDGSGPGGGSAACTPAFTISDTAPYYAKRGDDVTYYVLVQNYSFCKLNTLYLTEALPYGVTYVSADPAPSSVKKGRLAWDAINLGIGGIQLYEIHATVDNYPPSLTDLACAYTPWTGQQSCSSATITLYGH